MGAEGSMNCTRTTSARLALYGLPGSGKSTVAKIIAQFGEQTGRRVTIVRLASPLYEIQQLIYAVAGRPMLDPRQQDGLLLNDLGSHMRRINPQALTAVFESRVRQAEVEHPHGLIVCDDMRSPDVDAVRGLGFKLVHITAPTKLRISRKASRGDLAEGSDSHPTERPIDCRPDITIINDGSRAQLQLVVGELFR